MKQSQSMAARIAGLAVLASAPSVHGGGLVVPGYGSQAQPRAGAFVAKADDASALYYNPAGLAKQKGTSVHLGFNLIDFDQTYQRAGTYEPAGDSDMGPTHPYTGQEFAEVSDNSTPALGVGGFQGIPTFGVVSDLGGATPLTFAIGLIAEHGFPEREYGEDYAFEDPDVAPPPNRYDILEQDVSVAFPSIAAAYSITPQLDVGVRASWGFGGSKGRQILWGLRNYEEDIHSDAEFEVDVKDNFIPAASVGVMYRPMPVVEVGAQYQMRRKINFTGHGSAVLGTNLGLGPDNPDFIAPENDFPHPDCQGTGTITALYSCVNLTLPQTASLGARYILRDPSGKERGDVELDVVWEDWSAASDIEIIVNGKSGLTGLRLNPVLSRHGFRDTFSFRLGGGYGFDIGDNRLTARAGAAYDTAAAPNSWTRLDLDGMARTTLGAGIGFETSSLRFDLGGGLVLEGDRDVDVCNPDLDNLGCETPGTETPVDERDRPDPVQPLNGPNEQVESPFNAGHYEQGYVLLSFGVTYLF